MHEARRAGAEQLEDQIDMLSPCDLALVEGYKTNDLIPKLEVYRPAHGKPPIHPEHPNIVAVASDAPVEYRCRAGHQRSTRSVTNSSCNMLDLK
jgi:molybdopterin-guanine dinucleotide biosynthesis protein B